MTFESAQCEVCRNLIFDPSKLIAYRLRSRKPEIVNLNGREPWSGVRVVCDDCREFLSPPVVSTDPAPYESEE